LSMARVISVSHPTFALKRDRRYWPLSIPLLKGWSLLIFGAYATGGGALIR
jgi:hypothetical protein